MKNKPLLMVLAASVPLTLLLFQTQQVTAAEQTTAASPALTRFTRDALQDNPRVQAANAAVDASRARERAAGQALFNPELELDAEKTDVRTESIGISQTIDWGDQRGARTTVAQFENKAVFAFFQTVRQDLANQLLAGLGEYHTSKQINLLAEQKAGLMQDFAQLATQRYKAGDLNQVELDLAQLAANEAQLQLAETSNAVAQSLQSLYSITGTATNNWPSLPEQLPLLDFKSVDVDTTLRSLPAFRQAQASMSASRARVKVASSETTANPTIGVRTGREGSSSLTGLTLSIPLFVRNNFQAEVAAASADAIEAERQAEHAWRVSNAQLISTAKTYALTYKAWQQWLATGKTPLQRRISLLKKLWKAGELSTTDYLVQLRQTLDTQAAAVSLQGQLWQSWFGWLAASGNTTTWLGLETSPAK